MERFQRRDPATHGSVEVQILDLVRAADRRDEYREVQLLLGDGRRYRAICWRDPQQRGRHWWEEPGMVIVPDLTTEHVLAAVDDFLQRGAIEQAFEPLPAQ